MIQQVLLDMDGVIADFFTSAIMEHPSALNLGIVTPADLETRYPKDKGWDIPSALGVTSGEFWRKIDTYEFWRGLPAFAGAREFVESVSRMVPVAICTSPSLNSDCCKAKVDWINLHIGNQYPVYLCYRGGKEMFANERTLLIDDYDRNVEAFRKAGGRAILVDRPWSNPINVDYTSVDYTKLKTLVAEELTR